MEEKEIVELIDRGKLEYGINYVQFCRILGIHVATLKDWKIDIPIFSMWFRAARIPFIVIFLRETNINLFK